MDIIGYQDTQDSYIFCPQCCIFVFEYCAIHGPPLIIPDTEILKSPLPRTLPRAALTIPHALLHIAISIIPGAGLGVFSSRTIPPNVRFGPYRGRRTLDVTSTYCWQVFLNNKPAYVIDASEENNSNWMRYINCSRHFQEQNLVAYQHRGQIFYRTIKPIEPFTELLVFYGSEFAKLLGIDLRKYNRDDFYLEITQANDENKQEYVQNVKDDSVERRIEKNILNKTETNYNNEFGIIKYIESTEDTNEKKNIKNCHIQDTGKIIKNDNFMSDKASESNLKENRKETLIKYLTCDICDKAFNYTTDLTNHILHHAEKSFRCSYCEYETNLKDDLAKHISEKHTQHKYSCSYCKFTTYKKQHLNLHINTKHAKKKTFNCSLCKYTTFYKCYLNKHVNAKHEKKRCFNCSLCTYTTYYKYNLNGHVNTKHEKKRCFNCSLCTYTTYYKCNLNKHVNAKHEKKSL